MILLKGSSLVKVQPSYCKILISRQSPHEDCPLYLHSRLYGVTSITKRHSEVKTDDLDREMNTPVERKNPPMCGGL